MILVYMYSIWMYKCVKFEIFNPNVLGAIDVNLTNK